MCLQGRGRGLGLYVVADPSRCYFCGITMIAVTLESDRFVNFVSVYAVRGNESSRYS